MIWKIIANFIAKAVSRYISFRLNVIKKMEELLNNASMGCFIAYQSEDVTKLRRMLSFYETLLDVYVILINQNAIISSFSREIENNGMLYEFFKRYKNFDEAMRRMKELNYSPPWWTSFLLLIKAYFEPWKIENIPELARRLEANFRNAEMFIYERINDIVDVKESENIELMRKLEQISSKIEIDYRNGLAPYAFWKVSNTFLDLDWAILKSHILSFSTYKLLARERKWKGKTTSIIPYQRFEVFNNDVLKAVIYTDESGRGRGKIELLPDYNVIYISSYGMKERVWEGVGKVRRSDFKNKKLLKISHEKEKLSDYQIKIILKFGEGESYGNVVYLNEQCRPDFRDICFSYEESDEIIPIALTRVSEGEEAEAWIKINEIPISPDGIFVNLFFGSESYATKSTPEHVFIFYENFSKLSREKWEMEMEYDDFFANNSILKMRVKNLEGMETANFEIGFSERREWEQFYDHAVFKAHSIEEGTKMGTVGVMYIIEEEQFHELEIGRIAFRNIFYRKDNEIHKSESTVTPISDLNVQLRFYKQDKNTKKWYKNVLRTKMTFPLRTSLIIKNFYMKGRRLWEWFFEPHEIMIDELFVRQIAELEPKVEVME